MNGDESPTLTEEDLRVIRKEQRAERMVKMAKQLIQSWATAVTTLSQCSENLHAVIQDCDDLREDTFDEVMDLFAQIGLALTRAQQAAPAASPTIAPSPVSTATKKYPSYVRMDAVPRYDGHPSSWKRFDLLFTDAVGNNPNLTEAVKLDTLSKVLTGHSQAVLSYDTWREALDGLGTRLASTASVENDIYRIANAIKPIPNKAGQIGRASCRERV